ncbi:MAG: hypothetical protein JXR86_14290 [Spirochaetales bacterium]|nr:hypothetical protein [Spirochaetales bacterium]
MAVLKPFSRRKQKLSEKEIEAALSKIRGEYDKYIVTFHKSAALKDEFERRYRNALIESRDLENFLNEEIVAVKSIFHHQNQLKKDQLAQIEKARLKEKRKEQPDFADRVLEQFKQKITAYPRIKIHNDASYEIEHLYGAISQFEKLHWPVLDNFIAEHRSWALRGENSDFNTELWRFTPSGDKGIPIVLEKYCLLLDSRTVTLKEKSIEAQQCIKSAAFILNDILWCCKEIMKKGIDGSNIEKSLDFVQNIISDFRIKDLTNR